MQIGTIFVGLAAAVFLLFFITEPFRNKSQDVDALIEDWVASVPDTPEMPTNPVVDNAPDPLSVLPLQQAEGISIEETRTGARFCHSCGQPVNPAHRFCPNCGTCLVETD